MPSSRAPSKLNTKNNANISNRNKSKSTAPTDRAGLDTDVNAFNSNKSNILDDDDDGHHHVQSTMVVNVDSDADNVDARGDNEDSRKPSSGKSISDVLTEWRRLKSVLRDKEQQLDDLRKRTIELSNEHATAMALWDEQRSALLTAIEVGEGHVSAEAAKADSSSADAEKAGAAAAERAKRNAEHAATLKHRAAEMSEKKRKFDEKFASDTERLEKFREERDKLKARLGEGIEKYTGLLAHEKEKADTKGAQLQEAISKLQQARKNETEKWEGIVQRRRWETEDTFYHRVLDEMESAQQAHKEGEKLIENIPDLDLFSVLKSIEDISQIINANSEAGRPPAAVAAAA